MKKFLSLVMALAMTAGLATCASAANFTVNNAAAGETYTMYKIFEKDDAGYYVTSSQKATYTGLETYFTLSSASSANADEAKYYVAKKDDTTNDQIIAWAEGLMGTLEQASTGTAVSSNTNYNASTETLTLSYDNAGYYLVTSTLGNTVTIDTNETAAINDKNTDNPVVEDDFKQTADDTIELGATATYTLTFTATNSVTADGETNKIVAYTVKDSSESLDTFEVTSITVNGTAIAIPTTGTSGSELDFEIPWVDANNNPLYAHDSAVVITYTARVIGTGEAENTAQLNWKYDDGTTPEDPHEDTEDVYNYEVAVTKVVEGTSTPLAGAGFKIMNADGDYYTLTTLADDTQDVSWTENGTEMTSDANGKLAFIGLADGSYTLIETTVPDGYDKADDVEFTIDNESANNDADLTLDNTIEDAISSFTLPSTGGMGTTIFYVVGGLLVAGAAVALITKVRMGKEN